MRDDRTNSGYTLVELVVVIATVGVLSVLGSSLFVSRSAFSPLLATQQLASATLLAQQAALAGNSAGTLTVEQTAESFRFTVGAGSPEARTFSVERAGTSLSGVALPLTLSFNSQGGVATGASTNLTFSGDSTYQTCVSSLGAVYSGGCLP
ncbi:type II secretion system protein [Marinobacter salinisoli]|uniref:Type II secretion system protein n=1 Tax=Marinobacter salinisoli TaxID=2769486 RepID=A0ABX7MV36_9GAMM|nr:type II secretion system protein [Marinobacter salinisoli]QSP96034.1 type II secretion system protein [Marinobacter salinisoli]